MFEDKIKKSGLDVNYERKIDDFLKTGIEVDFNSLVYFQLNRVLVARSTGDLHLIKHCVDTFGDTLVGEEDKQFSEEMKEAGKVKSETKKRFTAILIKNKGFKPDDYERGIINNKALEIFYQLKFRALMLLCKRKGLFGQKEIMERY